MDGYDEATYGDRFVDVYDEWYGDITDTETCVDVLADLAHDAADESGNDGPNALELGVGTGRLAIPLRQRHLNVVGVDASAAMLDAMAAKEDGGLVVGLLGDMADPPIGETRFDLVFVAYNTIFNLTAPEAQQRCFDNVARCLFDHGRFLVEAFVPSPTHVAGDAVFPKQVTADKVVLSVVQACAAEQEIVGQYVDITAAGVSLRPWHIRWATPSQLDAMAMKAGLVLETRWAGWDRSPFAEESGTHISVYRRT